MSDDTTTWLKKNPVINPMRKSLKNSLRFHVPSADMDASIISNPDKMKSQEIFIPRMLQRTNAQLRMSRAHQFKVPELTVSKPVKKKENTLGSGVKTKKSPAVRKSFLPVRKALEKDSKKVNLPKPSLIPGGGSGRRTLARREIFQKMVELSEIKKIQEETFNQSKVSSSENSVLRSILKKKRASLRRISQISGVKPKAKKVLFNGFETSDADEKEKEKDATSVRRTEKESDDFAVLDEPTAFFNFPNPQKMETTPQVTAEHSSSFCETETDHREYENIAHILKIWNSCKENVNNLQSMKDSLEVSYDSFFQQAQTFKNQYDSYKKDSEHIYAQLSKLSEELEENIRKTLEGSGKRGGEETPKSKRRSAGKKLMEKVEKIRLSDKSKVIKKNSATKTALIKKEFLKDVEESFSIAYKKSFMDN